MSDLGNFFRQLAERIDANGGVLPKSILDALSTDDAPVVVKKRRKTSSPIEEYADSLVSQHLFGIGVRKKKTA